EVLAPLAARVRRALALDFDPSGFQQACAGDPLLQPVARLGLGRLLRGMTPFEDAVRVLVWGDDAPTDTARALARVGSLGARCPAQPVLRACPSAATLARFDVRRLRERTGLGRRAVWVHRLARQVASGRRDLRAIESLSTRAAARALEGVPGLEPAGVARLLL